MPGIVGRQDLWITGSRFYFQNEDDAYGTLLDLGTIETANPNLTTEKIQVKDGDGGLQTLLDEAVTSLVESYDITTVNCSLDNLALFFLAADPEYFSQSATPISNVDHTAPTTDANHHIKLVDSNGDWIYNVASATVKNSSLSVTYVENTDWKWLSKDRGIITIMSGGAIAQGQALKISITPNAYSGKRLVRPQTQQQIAGKAMIVWGRESNASQTVREMDVVITPNNGQLSVTDYSKLTFTVSVKSDVTDTQLPAGKLLQTKGSLPTGV